MSQGSVTMPTAGIVSGVTFAQDVNTALDALRTMFSGASPPSADAPEEGQLWLDTGTSTAYKLLRVFDGSTWPVRAWLDDVNHFHIAPVAGGGLSTVASASTTVLGASTVSSNQSVTPSISISGTTGITSFGSVARLGELYFLTFQGVLTLTYNAVSLILPGNSNITTAAGDMAIFQYLGSGNWQCLVYQPRTSLIGSVGTVTGAFVTNNVISPTQITANQNDYSPSGAANATIWELSTDGLSDYLITGISASQVSGRRILIRNVNAAGGGRIYFPNQSTSSASANRFKQAGVVQLNPQQQVEFIYDNSVTAWVPQNVVLAQPVMGGRRNLMCGNAAGFNFTAPASPNTNYKITADALTLVDADFNTVTLNNVSVTAQSSVSGVNGLDSTAGVGLSTGVWYSGWVIYNPITNTAAALLSTSITAPTLPSGYTYKARCGWVTTYNSTTKNFFPVLQKDAFARYVPTSTSMQMPLLSTVTNNAGGGVSTAALSVAIDPFFPPTANRANISLNCCNNPGGQAYIGILTSTAYWGQQGSSNWNGALWTFLQAGFTMGSVDGWVILESSHVYYFSNSFGFAGAFAMGWEDGL